MSAHRATGNRLTIHAGSSRTRQWRCWLIAALAAVVLVVLLGALLYAVGSLGGPTPPVEL